MERLTCRRNEEGFKNANVLLRGKRFGPAFFPDKQDYQDYSDVLERLAQYEDEEEAGKLLILPCAIGDKIYRIEGRKKPPRILAAHVVEKIEITTSGIWLCFGWRSMGYEVVHSRDIGKTFFLNPDDGYAAMKASE